MRKYFIYLFILLFFPLILFANSGGTNSGEALLIYPEASLNASGNAGVGLFRPDWQFIQLNPAFLSVISNKTIGFSHNEYIEDMTQSNLSFINDFKNHRYYFSVNYFDYGDFSRTTYDPDQDNTGSFTANSIILKNYYSLPKIGDIYFGAGIKLFYEKLDSYEGRAVAIDLGGLYVWEEHSTAIGFTIQNIGTPIKYNTKDENLPLMFRLGASSYLFEDKFGLFLDIEKIRNQDVNYLFGIEYSVFNIAKIRAGIDGTNNTNRALNLGLDINLRNGFQVNYAFVPSSYFDDSHKLTLAYNFGIFPKTIEPIKTAKTVKTEETTDDYKEDHLKVSKQLYTEKTEKKLLLQKQQVEIIPKEFKVMPESYEVSELDSVIFIVQDRDNYSVELEISPNRNFISQNSKNFIFNKDRYIAKLDRGHHYWRYRFIDKKNNNIGNWITGNRILVYKPVSMNIDRKNAEVVILDLFNISDLLNPVITLNIEEDMIILDINENDAHKYVYSLKGFDKYGNSVFYNRHIRLLELEPEPRTIRIKPN